MVIAQVLSLQNEGLEPILKKHDSTKNERALKKNSQLTDPLVVEVFGPGAVGADEGPHAVDDDLQHLDVVAVERLGFDPLVLSELGPRSLEVGLDGALEQRPKQFRTI